MISRRLSDDQPAVNVAQEWTHHEKHGGTDAKTKPHQIPRDLRLRCLYTFCPLIVDNENSHMLRCSPCPPPPAPSPSQTRPSPPSSTTSSPANQDSYLEKRCGVLHHRLRSLYSVLLLLLHGQLQGFLIHVEHLLPQVETVHVAFPLEIHPGVIVVLFRLLL